MSGNLNDPRELAKRFTYHAPDDVKRRAHERVREGLMLATDTVLTVLRETIGNDSAREAAVFVTKMEEAMFWANAAIARASPGGETGQ